MALANTKQAAAVRDDVLRKRLKRLEREQFSGCSKYRMRGDEAIIQPRRQLFETAFFFFFFFFLLSFFLFFFRDCKNQRPQTTISLPKAEKEGEFMIGFWRRTKAATFRVTASASNWLCRLGLMSELDGLEWDCKYVTARVKAIGGSLRFW